MPETQRSLGNATVERREADVPVARDGHASQAWGRVLPARRTKVVRLPALRRPLISGSELQLSQGFGREPRRSAGQGSGDAVDKEQRRDNPGAENAPRERDVLCGRRRGAGCLTLWRMTTEGGPYPGPGFAFTRGHPPSWPDAAHCRLAGGDRYPSHSA